MSFSSDMSSSSADSLGGVSTAPSSPPSGLPDSQFYGCRTSHPPPQPNYKTLEKLLLSSVTLARRSFTRHSTFGIGTPTAHYLSLHARVNRFLKKYRKHDFVQDGTYGYVVEIGILLRLAESALGMAHREIIGLECEEPEKQQDERQKLEKRCSRDVDYLVFGGRDLDVGRLPWNLTSEGATQEA
ncbi:uncharacterized protein CC84DRAFT_429105 [Paraphaeosphaeria sporulosa]|uniref:Uncharacterized protein n=1 Tax=Paraphaeosphaeria sporulosa TaxID=1460663 RepID=A0A177BW99_9PLEO|nr:uncharacterized protein CC84DRAFT_429105 [Paraphaeosphaeria sporulosa]OAF98646.1 hypothetical protein CC84DRAFT_429105 [Paraphaeosphaeria sporulosa]